jgi:hypothetical protein
MFILVNGHKEIETDSEKAILRKFKELLLAKGRESCCIFVNMDNAPPLPVIEVDDRRDSVLPAKPKGRLSVSKQKRKK